MAPPGAKWYAMKKMQQRQMQHLLDSQKNKNESTLSTRDNVFIWVFAIAFILLVVYGPFLVCMLFGG